MFNGFLCPFLNYFLQGDQEPVSSNLTSLGLSWFFCKLALTGLSRTMVAT